MGWDPHLTPQGKRVSLQPDANQEWTASGFDRSVWSVVLTEGLGGAIEVVTPGLQHVLKAGVEIHHPIAVKGGGSISPTLAVLAGPLEEASIKLRQLKSVGPVLPAGRWPTASDGKLGDAAIHRLVTAQPSPSQEWRLTLVEGMIKDLFDDVLGTGPGMASAVLLRDGEGAIALHRALALGRYEVASNLLHVAPTAQAHALDHRGNGAFHALVSAGWPAQPAPMLKLARELAQHGARWHDPNEAGLSAADLAQQRAKSDEERLAWRGLAQRSGASVLGPA